MNKYDEMAKVVKACKDNDLDVSNASIVFELTKELNQKYEKNNSFHSSQIKEKDFKQVNKISNIFQNKNNLNEKVSIVHDIIEKNIKNPRVYMHLYVWKDDVKFYETKRLLKVVRAAGNIIGPNEIGTIMKKLGFREDRYKVKSHIRRGWVKKTNKDNSTIKENMHTILTTDTFLKNDLYLKRVKGDINLEMGRKAEYVHCKLNPSQTWVNKNDSESSNTKYYDFIEGEKTIDVKCTKNEEITIKLSKLDGTNQLADEIACYKMKKDGLNFIYLGSISKNDLLSLYKEKKLISLTINNKEEFKISNKYLTK